MIDILENLKPLSSALTVAEIQAQIYWIQVVNAHTQAFTCNLRENVQGKPWMPQYLYTMDPYVTQIKVCWKLIVGIQHTCQINQNLLRSPELMTLMNECVLFNEHLCRLIMIFSDIKHQIYMKKLDQMSSF